MDNPFVELRKRLGVDRKTFCFAIGITTATLYHYESGRAKNISPSIQVKLGFAEQFPKYL
jgi:DNA-binding XRE family transcriptional regulator